MKNSLIFLVIFFLLKACTGSSPSAPMATEAPPVEIAADTTDEYYDPSYKMPEKTKWVLQRINGQEMAAAKIRGEVPTLEINLDEGKARGTGGCNRFNASVKLEDNSIRFGHILATKDKCPSYNLEVAYFRILNFGLLTYQWTPGKLIIQRDVRSVLEFRPAR